MKYIDQEKRDQEEAEKKAQKQLEKKIKRLVRITKNDCSKLGLRNVELRLEFIKSNPLTTLPDQTLTFEQNVAAMIQGIELYKFETHLKK